MPSPSWCRPVTSATRACRKPVRRRCAARTRCTRCPTCKSNTRCCPVGSRPEILPTCRELGVGITAYGVLSRGLLGGHWPAGRELTPNDFRTTAPRFSAENIGTNLSLVEALRSVAEARGATVAQVAVAWVAAQGDDIVPLIGAKRPDRLAEAVAALDIRLTPDDVADIERAVPPDAVAGQRYDVHGMAALDSEHS